MRANSIGPAAALVAFGALAGEARAQLEVTYRDADLGGSIDVVMAAPAGTAYITIASLTEGPTCFGPKHPVGCIDVDLALIDFSFLLPGLFGTMGPSGTLTATYPLDPDPALDGVLVNVQMVSLVGGKLADKSNLCKVEFAFPDSWHDSVAPLINDPAAIPAIELDDGRIALLGAAGANLDQCEAWEPWRQVSSPLAPLLTGRAGHTVTKLQDGRVLICGGSDLALNVLSSGEVYDPATDTWTATGAMGSVRLLHTASLLPDGRVLIAGGTTVADILSGPTNALRTTEYYDPATNAFSAGPNLARPHVGHFAATLASGDVLMGGGATYTTIFSTRVPALDNRSQVYQVASASFAAEKTMKAARVVASAALLADGRVLVAGGIGGSILTPSDLSSSETFDPTTSAWTSRGSMSLGRSGFPLLVLPGTNHVLAAGGATGAASSTPTATDLVELFDPTTNLFSPRTSLPQPRTGPAGIVLGSHHAALFGGVGAPSEAAIYHD